MGYEDQKADLDAFEAERDIRDRDFDTIAELMPIGNRILVKRVLDVMTPSLIQLPAGAKDATLQFKVLAKGCEATRFPQIDVGDYVVVGRNAYMTLGLRGDERKHWALIWEDDILAMIRRKEGAKDDVE